MENFLNRYRNVTVLLLAIAAQLVLLGVQVKNDQDVRVIRLWTVTAVTPVARVLEAMRSGSSGFLRNYILMHQANEDARRLKDEVDRLRVENIFLRNELSLADRAKALQAFRERTPSKSLAASVIGIGAGSTSRIIFVDRGSVAGVERGMPVVTPEGIVGKVTAAYPTASEVLLITDPEFAAGAVSQKSLVRGTVKGQGTPVCKLDYVPNDEKLAAGEWLYTSGDDRIFPRGFPIGMVKSVHPGQPFQEVYVEPTALRHGLEDVLILLEGVHEEIPSVPPDNQPVYIAAPPANEVKEAAPATGPATQPGTEADKLRSQYKAIGDAQGHKFGEGAPGVEAARFQPQAARGRCAGDGSGNAGRPGKAFGAGCARRDLRSSPRHATATAGERLHRTRLNSRTAAGACARHRCAPLDARLRILPDNPARPLPRGKLLRTGLP